METGIFTRRQKRCLKPMKQSPKTIQTTRNPYGKSIKYINNLYTYRAHLRGGNEARKRSFLFRARSCSNRVSMHHMHVFESLMWGEMPSVANGPKCPKMFELFWVTEMSLHFWDAAFLHHGLRANRDSSTQVPAKSDSLLINVSTFLGQFFRIEILHHGLSRIGILHHGVSRVEILHDGFPRVEILHHGLLQIEILHHRLLRIDSFSL